MRASSVFSVTAAAFALLIAAVAGAAYLVVQLNMATRWVEHTLIVREATNDLLSAIQQAEAGERGFILTHRSAFLASYNEGATTARDLEKRVRGLTEDNPAQQAAFELLAKVSATKLDELAASIALEQRGRHDEALAAADTDRSAKLMSAVSAAVDKMVAGENALLKSRQQRQSQVRSFLVLSTLIALMLSIFLASLVVRSMRVALATSRKNELELSDLVSERTAQMEYVMHEVAHRAKNQLAIIKSIARQSAKTSQTVAEFHASFEGRVQALAVSMDELMRLNWQGASFYDLVEKQLAPFATVGARLILAGNNFDVTPEAAQSLGMAFHELATNAAKYGALSVSTGKVHIEWSADGDSICIRWRERGGPAVVAAPTQTGFGHVVMETMVAQSVDGTVTMKYPRAGFEWELIAPSDRVRSERTRRTRTADADAFQSASGSARGGIDGYGQPRPR